MLEAKVLHKKTYTKNVKVAKMMEFIKTCGRYLCQFCYFFFQLHHPLPPFSSGKNILKNAVFEEWAIPVCLEDNDKNLG